NKKLKIHRKIAREISNLGRTNKKLKIHRKIAREIFRLYRDISRLLYIFYIKKKLNLK
ncbi:lipooligosaccharide biosynthesis glycosyltransferase, partial [Campylobacter coli]|nr:lipooligosaccharide biosynthesis glycosyltransferase [Campylobacter coli]